MHLLIIHQNFVDHQHPGGTRHFELARQLVQRGHRCTIVAGSVDFLTGQALTCRPESIDGVQIRRAYAFPTLHHSYLGRVVSYLCFMVTSLWEGLRCRSVDVVMGTSPPTFQLPSAWLVARLKRRPFLLEIRDLWPDFAVEMGVLRSRLLIALARRVERFFYRHQDWTLINSPGFRDHLQRCGVASDRLTVVPNGVETSMFDPDDRGRSMRRRWGLDDEFIAMYAGSLGLANDLPTLLDAAEDLRDEPNVRIVIVGAGKDLPALNQSVADRGLTNVIFAGAFPKTEMSGVLAAANVCVATLQDRQLFATVYPNKVFDYMAAGRPTILTIDGVMRRTIEDARAGTFVPAGRPAELARVLRDYLQDPQRCEVQGRAGRAYACEYFERADQAAVLESVLHQIARNQPSRNIYRAIFKRPLDVSVALLMAILLSPLIVVVALLVRWRLGSPVLFRQTRGGLRGRPFTLLKFRTMREAVDSQGQPLTDEARLTPFGKALRSLSLDELPQLWNILKGDMSLIGPRPLLVRYLPRYSAEQARRHLVRPGITGWAQVNGRNAISWDEKFHLDVWYVDHCSLWLDLKIIGLTIWHVLARRGISSQDHATMPEFRGDATAVDRPASMEETVQ